MKGFLFIDIKTIMPYDVLKRASTLWFCFKNKRKMSIFLMEKTFTIKNKKDKGFLTE